VLASGWAAAVANPDAAGHMDTTNMGISPTGIDLDMDTEISINLYIHPSSSSIKW
jgi:hypothetical protein